MSVSQNPGASAGHISVGGLPRSAPLLDPGALTRAGAHLFSWRLDRALMAGADPAGSRMLAARAALLTSAKSRRSLAQALHRLVRAAQGPQRRWWALSSRASINANTSELAELARLLENGTALYAGGLASLNELLKDGTGPVYRGDATALSRALSDVRTALTG